MLGRDPFRHDLLRKYQMVFGTMFNDIRITRINSEGEVEHLYRVPLSYAPKEKILARVMADPAIDRKAATILPRMSFELTDISYNPDNKLRSVGRHVIRITDDEDELVEQYNPVPYDLHFTLWVFTKYIEDGQQIIEQILPYFTPQFTATVNLMEGVNLDCQVLLRKCTPQDLYNQGDYTTRRATMWTLEFTVTGYLFGPVKRHPVIKFANVSLYSATSYEDIQDAVGEVEAIDRVTVQPGLTANGEPTTNVDLTVEYSEISATDDWDYVVTISGSLVPGDIGGNEGDAAGEIDLSASLSSDLDDATSSSEGEISIEGDLSASLEAATLSAVGIQEIYGSLEAALETASVSAAGEIDLSASLSSDLGDATLSAVGIQEIYGSLEAALETATFSSEGELALEAESSPILEAATLSSSSELLLQASLDETLDGVTFVSNIEVAADLPFQTEDGVPDHVWQVLDLTEEYVEFEVVIEDAENDWFEVYFPGASVELAAPDNYARAIGRADYLDMPEGAFIKLALYLEGPEGDYDDWVELPDGEQTSFDMQGDPFLGHPVATRAQYVLVDETPGTYRFRLYFPVTMDLGPSNEA